MKNYTFLQDKRFLQQLFALRIKEQFIKITVLNWKEEPLEQIQGSVISGSVNLDGNSSMRRTATLSLFAEEKENNLANVDHLFSINKKCVIELGIVNKVSKLIFKSLDEITSLEKINVINYQELYGDIVWFPLGVYVMFNPSIAHSMTGVTISMQLKDKMCLLNGDLGGEIHSSVDFAHEDEIVDVNSLTEEKNPVLIYNIIKQLVNHWGNESLNKIIISEVPRQIKMVVKWMGNEPIYVRQDHVLTVVPGDGRISFDPGEDVGYVYEDFVYPGELVCNAGETVTSVLDKLIQVMGNYQYFYDVFGNFIFQEKANCLNMTNTAYWQKEESKKSIDLPKDNYETTIRLTKSIYDFSDNDYIVSYNNSLNYNNIKNDFVVWGAFESVDTNYKTPCRFHLAIDKKPEVPIDGIKHKHIAFYKDDFQTIRAVGLVKDQSDGTGDKYILPKGRENLLEYLIEEESDQKIAYDWREQIYYQMIESEKYGTDNNTELNNSYFQYYAQLKQEFPKIFDLETHLYKQEYIDHPDQIAYFLDFIDEDSQLGQYSVNNIGRRAKIVDGNNQGINCVFEPNIPDTVYININDYRNRDQAQSELEQRLTDYGQNWVQIDSSIANLFDIKTGGNLNSCYERIKDLLYQYTHVNNTISITGLPIYYLQPNTRITVEDKPGGIYGDYIIQSISLPLDITSTMTINAYKALQKI